MKHKRSSEPAFIIPVEGKPLSLQSKRSKREWMEKVREEAARQFESPIASSDVEVEIIVAVPSRKDLGDADNLAKQILDALTGVAWNDDSQVRETQVRIIGLGDRNVLEGQAEYLKYLFKQGEGRVLILIYSDQALESLGGSKKVAARRQEDHLKQIEEQGRAADWKVRKFSIRTVE